MSSYTKVIILLILINNTVLAQHLPFQDPSLPLEIRIDDLISRLTLEEKSAMMRYNSPAIDRLGIPAYNWWNECLHGIGRAGKATVFPQAIALAATFDDSLVFRIASAIGDEARAKHHTAIRNGSAGQYTGLNFWTPNINIFRDPRWGRGQETYGEDPFLTATIGVSFVRGLQGNDPTYLKAAACAKHFAVHSGPEKIRHSFDAVPSETDLYDTYLPAFKALAEAKVEAVMCAYNRVYGLPCCGSPFLLGDILRKDWNFEGHVVSDCWALDDFWLRHKVVDDQVKAAAMAALAGVNLNCGYIYQYLPEAVLQGLITEETVDHNLKPLLKTRFRLGLFDPDSLNPYTSITGDIVDGPDHRALAYEAAVKSMVLLKNDGILPFDRSHLKTLFVTGPTATDITALYGNYNGFSGELVTFLEGIIRKVTEGTVVEYNQGVIFNNDTAFQGYWQAERSDVVIACLGINSLFEGEEGEAMYNADGGDRKRIELPDNQTRFIEIMRQKYPEKPIVAVVTGGSAISLTRIMELANAVVFAWYPGEEGGNALANILFGDENPSGRLPVTFYRSTEDLPPFDDYRMTNRTYRYYRGTPLFPFGFGLSYTTFDYREVAVNTRQPEETDTICLTIQLANTGLLAGSEVVQVYLKYPGSRVTTPVKSLKGFGRISLPAGSSGTISISIPVAQLALWDEEKHDFRIAKGAYLIQVGASSEDIRMETTVTIR